MLQNLLKICSISTLSLLVACAGSAPKMERPIKLWSGTPERMAVCRLVKARAAKAIESMVRRDNTKKHVKQLLAVALANDELECIKADSDAFKSMAAISFDDLGVIMRYNENLLYSCERWKQ